MEYYDFPIDQVDAQSKASDKLPTASDKLPTAADCCTEGVAGGSSRFGFGFGFGLGLG